MFLLLLVKTIYVLGCLIEVKELEILKLTLLLLYLRNSREENYLIITSMR